jgi:hypothetical protein
MICLGGVLCAFQLKKMYILRRILNPMGTMDAIDFLLDKLRNTKSNADFFDQPQRAGDDRVDRRGAGSCSPRHGNR